MADFSPATLLAENGDGVGGAGHVALADAAAGDCRGAPEAQDLAGSFGWRDLQPISTDWCWPARPARSWSDVPYKGSAQATITDLLAGHVDSVFLTTSALDAMMTKQGKIRLLAVSGEKRTQLLHPMLPTFKEQGVPQLEVNGWFGLFGPKGTPAPLLDRLAAIAKTLAEDQPFRTPPRRPGLRLGRLYARRARAGTGAGRDRDLHPHRCQRHRPGAFAMSDTTVNGAESATPLRKQAEEGLRKVILSGQVRCR